mgnify:CR=1 FL=1
MKKLISVILISLSVSFGYGQAFPVTNAQGAPNTLSLSKGGIQAGVGLINTLYSDTTAANLNLYLKNYAGAQIYTTSDNNFWLRNTVIGKWTLVGGSGGGITVSNPPADSTHTFLYGFNSSNIFSNSLVQGLDSFKCSINSLADSIKTMRKTSSSAQYGWLVYDAAMDVDNDVRIIISKVDQTNYFTKKTINYTNINGLTKDYISYTQNTPTYSPYSFNLLAERKIYANNVFDYGINEPFTLSQVSSLISNASKFDSLKTFFQTNKIKYFRYPGGTVVRYFFWDNQLSARNLADMASDRIADYYDTAYAAFGDTKLQNKATTNRNRVNTYNFNNYAQFLNFCTETQITPIIVLNTFFYRDHDTIYPVNQFQDNITPSPINIGFQAGRFDSLKKTIQAQVVYTHSVSSGKKIWELGNENYNIIPSGEYASLVVMMMHWIRELYPTDEVCVSINSASEDSPNPNRNKNKIVFDETLIKTLTDSSLLYQTNYWVKHYYYNNQFLYSNQDSINKVISDNYIADADTAFISQAKGELPDNYPLKMLITEFQEIEKYDISNGANKQVSALMLFDYFIKFASKKNDVQAIFRHTGIGNNNGLYYDSTTAAVQFPGTFNPAVTSSNLWKYIVPAGYVSKIFMAINGQNFINYFFNDKYEAVLTKTADTLYFQILNYTSTANPINIKSYAGTKTYTTYVFNNLDAYYWDPDANKTTGSVTNTLTMPAHSFTTIKIIR